MSCNGICERYRAKRNYNIPSRYTEGQKRCSVCEIFIKWDENSSGNYNLYFLANSGQTYEIQAYYAGDNNHPTSSATTKIDIKEKNSGGFTQP